MSSNAKQSRFLSMFESHKGADVKQQYKGKQQRNCDNYRHPTPKEEQTAFRDYRQNVDERKAPYTERRQCGKPLIHFIPPKHVSEHISRQSVNGTKFNTRTHAAKQTNGNAIGGAKKFTSTTAIAPNGSKLTFALDTKLYEVRSKIDTRDDEMPDVNHLHLLESESVTGSPRTFSPASSGTCSPRFNFRRRHDSKSESDDDDDDDEWRWAGDDDDSDGEECRSNNSTPRSVIDAQMTYVRAGTDGLVTYSESPDAPTPLYSPREITRDLRNLLSLSSPTARMDDQNLQENNFQACPVDACYQNCETQVTMQGGNNESPVNVAISDTGGKACCGRFNSPCPHSESMLHSQQYATCGTNYQQASDTYVSTSAQNDHGEFTQNVDCENNYQPQLESITPPQNATIVLSPYQESPQQVAQYDGLVYSDADGCYYFKQNSPSPASVDNSQLAQACGSFGSPYVDENGVSNAGVEDLPPEVQCVTPPPASIGYLVPSPNTNIVYQPSLVTCADGRAYWVNIPMGALATATADTLSPWTENIQLTPSPVAYPVSDLPPQTMFIHDAYGPANQTLDMCETYYSQGVTGEIADVSDVSSYADSMYSSFDADDSVSSVQTCSPITVSTTQSPEVEVYCQHEAYSPFGSPNSPISQYSDNLSESFQLEDPFLASSPSKVQDERSPQSYSNKTPDTVYSPNSVTDSEATPGLAFEPEVTLPALHVTDDGLITVILRGGVILEMTPDKALRLVHHEKKLVVALNDTGAHACIIHPAARISQAETSVHAQLFLGRRIKMTSDEIVLGSYQQLYK